MQLKYIIKPNETMNMGIYVLFVKLTGDNASHNNPDWESLAKQFGFRIIRQWTSQATVEVSAEAIALLQKVHPEIQVTIEKKYHKADIPEPKFYLPL